MLTADTQVKVPSPLHKYYRYTRQSGVCGVEVEVEFLRLNREYTNDLLAVWNPHVDGSLRHTGVEYTMHKPMSGVKKDKAIVTICEFINSQAHVVESPRTSVHTHVNVQRLTPVQIWNACTLYWLMEPALMEYCGSERVGNPFCLRIIDALNLVDVSISDLKGALPFGRFRGNDEIRYAGLNLQPLRSFGSLEFRGMRGIYDPKIIIPWTDMLVYVVHSSAKKWDNPSAILDEFFSANREDFFKKVLGDYYGGMFQPFFRKASDEIDEVTEAILPFAYFHDWNRWQAKMEENLVKDKTKRGKDVPLVQANAIDLDRDIPPPRNFFVGNIGQDPINLDEAGARMDAFVEAFRINPNPIPRR